MLTKLILPGDIIQLTTTRFGARLKWKKFVVTEASYTNGVRFSTADFAWVYNHECKYAGRATRKQFLAAMRRAEGE